jgi:hypothetical protein
MSLCCECCVLLGRDLCDELVSRPEGSYRLWCVFVCDLETSEMRRSCPIAGCCAKKIKKIEDNIISILDTNYNTLKRVLI